MNQGDVLWLVLGHLLSVLNVVDQHYWVLSKDFCPMVTDKFFLNPIFPVRQMFPTSWSWSPVAMLPAGLDSPCTSWLPVSQINSAGWLSWSRWWLRGGPPGRRPRPTQWVSLEQDGPGWVCWLIVSITKTDNTLRDECDVCGCGAQHCLRAADDLEFTQS